MDTVTVNKTDRKHIPTVVVMLVDVLLVNLAFIMAFVLRFGWHIPGSNFKPFLTIAPFISVAVLVIFSGLGLYERRCGGCSGALRATLVGAMGIFLVSTFLIYYTHGFSFPRSVLPIAAIMQIMLITAWRTCHWYLERKLHGVQRLLVVGPSEEIERLLIKVMDLPEGWFNIVGALDVSAIDRLPGLLPEIDAVLLVPSLPEEKKNMVLVACQTHGCEVFWVPGYHDIALSNAKVTQLDDLPVMELKEIGLDKNQRMVKRAVDLAVAAAGLLITLPLMLVIAILIKTTPGSVFFTQRRVGRDNRIYQLIKFRTMVQDAEKYTGPVLAEENDPRITTVGKFLRSTRLDELPQLINVLKGDMSFVGPRPERPFFVNQFNKQNPNYNLRHKVKPGITGLAQVAGKYTTTPEDKLRFDLYYIQSYSLLLDFKIILKTIPVVLTRDSSAGRKNVSARKKAAVYAFMAGNMDKAHEQSQTLNL